MSVTVQLRPEIEQKLREKATQEGKTVEEYLGRLAEQSLTSNGAAPNKKPRANDDMGREKRLQAWKEFGSTRQSVASNADDSRESIYEGRGE